MSGKDERERLVREIEESLRQGESPWFSDDGWRKILAALREREPREEQDGIREARMALDALDRRQGESQTEWAHRLGSDLAQPEREPDGWVPASAVDWLLQYGMVSVVRDREYAADMPVYFGTPPQDPEQ